MLCDVLSPNEKKIMHKIIQQNYLAIQCLKAQNFATLELDLNLTESKPYKQTKNWNLST